MSKVLATATVKAIKNKRFAQTKAALVLTESAVNQVKKLLKKDDKAIGLRIGVRQRGCNGLSYVLEYTGERMKFDEEVIQEGIRIIIDKKAQLTLLGTEMDFVENDLSSEFVFNNPNVNGTCGCGESFTVGDSFKPLSSSSSKEQGSS